MTFSRYSAHLFFYGMHHYECIAPYVDISLQSGWFWEPCQLLH